MKNSIQTIVASKTIKGTSFIGIRNYENTKSEISNQTILVGANLITALESDLKKLVSKSVNDFVESLKNGTNNEIVNTAYSELIDSLIKRTATETEKAKLLAENDTTMVRSQAQKDAFTYISKGIKAKDNNLYINGFVIAKKVLKKGTYKKVNHRPKTIIKNAITKFCDFKASKFRTFKIENIETLKIQGFELK